MPCRATFARPIRGVESCMVAIFSESSPQDSVRQKLRDGNQPECISGLGSLYDFPQLSYQRRSMAAAAAG